MQNNGRTICKIFEQEYLLFMDGELSVERIELYRNHLKKCHACSELINEVEQFFELAAKEPIGLYDLPFDEMIARAASSNKNLFLTRLFKPGENGKEVYIFTRVALTSIIIIAAVILSLFSDKSNTVKSVGKDLLDWEGKKIVSQINEIKNGISRVSGGEWKNEIDRIEVQLEQREKKSDPYSF